jgi:hypothetical protein
MADTRDACQVHTHARQSVTWTAMWGATCDAAAEERGTRSECAVDEGFETVVRSELAVGEN